MMIFEVTDDGCCKYERIDTSNQQTADRREFFIETACQGVFVFFSKKKKKIKPISLEESRKSTKNNQPEWLSPPSGPRWYCSAAQEAEQKTKTGSAAAVAVQQKRRPNYNNWFVWKWLGATSCIYRVLHFAYIHTYIYNNSNDVFIPTTNVILLPLACLNLLLLFSRLILFGKPFPTAPPLTVCNLIWKF